MKKVYTLSTCDTSRRILKQAQLSSLGFEIIDIKTTPLTEKSLYEMHKLSGSYEALFSRRSLKYKSMKLKDTKLSEVDYKKLILQEYTGYFARNNSANITLEM